MAKLTQSWHAYDNHKHLQMKTNRNCYPHYGFNTSTEKHRELLERRRRLNSEEGGSEGTELDPECPCYHEATRPYPKPFVQKLKLW